MTFYIEVVLKTIHTSYTCVML